MLKCIICSCGYAGHHVVLINISVTIVTVIYPVIREVIIIMYA